MLLPFCSGFPAFTTKSSETKLYAMVLLRFVEEILSEVTKGLSPEEEFNWMKLLLVGNEL